MRKSHSECLSSAVEAFAMRKILNLKSPQTYAKIKIKKSNKI